MIDIKAWADRADEIITPESIKAYFTMNKQLLDFCEYIINMMEAMEPDTWTATEYNIYEYAMSLMEQYNVST